MRTNDDGKTGLASLSGGEGISMRLQVAADAIYEPPAVSAEEDNDAETVNDFSSDFGDLG